MSNCEENLYIAFCLTLSVLFAFSEALGLNGYTEAKSVTQFFWMWVRRVGYSNEN
jgi:hypothetical protein